MFGFVITFNIWPFDNVIRSIIQDHGSALFTDDCIVFCISFKGNIAQ